MNLKPIRGGRVAPEPIAIIGLAAIFPGAGDLNAYWDEVLSGRGALTEIPASYWSAADYYDPDPKAQDRTYALRGGFLSPVPFDALRFGIAPNDLPSIDSAQLLALIAADRALADAGYPAGGNADHRRTAVILGVTGALKLVVSLGSRLAHPQIKKALADSGLDEGLSAEVLNRFADEFAPWTENSFPGLLGNVVAGRVAGRLDLGGANLAVDAACASSLAAVRHALMELRCGQADLAITGGVDAFNDPFMFTCFAKTPALSPTQRARAYDRNGDGTALGEGVGLLTLKRLADARRDGDRIYAIIREVGAASDGKGAAIFAPSAKGQESALARTYELAGVDPGTVELLEGHGTGTNVGDAVEVEALTRVFRQSPRAAAGRPWCALGSVKAQIGHTKAAAGAAGLIKAALALYYKTLPPAAQLEQPLEELLKPTSPFHLSTRPRPWVNSGKQPRRAAVSAFGFGGTNFHCLLEEAGPAQPEPAASPWEILALSGDGPAALKAALERAQGPDGRRDFGPDDSARLVIVCTEDDRAEKIRRAGELLSRPEPEAAEWPRGVFFGQGPAAEKSFGLLMPPPAEAKTDLFRELAIAWPEMLKSLGAAQAAQAAQAPELGPLGQILYPPDFVSDDYRQTLAAAWEDARPRRAAWLAVAEGLTALLGRFALKPAATADMDGFEPGRADLWLALGPLASAPALNGARLAVLADGWLGLAEFLADLAARGWPVDLSAWPSAPARPGPAGAAAVMITGANVFVRKGSAAPPRLAAPAPPSAPARPVAPRRALEALAEETARIHQDFLRRQAETLRLLGLELAGAAPVQPMPVQPMPVQAMPVQAAPAQAAAGADQGEIEDLVLGVIARETGYPREMLNPDMSLEGDLGLDSIKKVEIISLLGEKRPEAAFLHRGAALNEAATPRDLIALFKASPAPAPAFPAAPPPLPVAPTAPLEPMAHGNLWPELRAVVARETGYPVEMLTPQMRVNEDLGLDSIKMVEILSLMSESSSRTEAVSAETALKAATLGELAEILARVAPAGAAPTLAEGEKSAAANLVFETVARETGYPRASLNPSLTLEGDLGLDSIKKVEIMSALGEKAPAAQPLVAAGALNGRAIHTLGDLIAMIGNAPPAGGAAPFERPRPVPPLAAPAAAPPLYPAPGSAPGSAPDQPRKRGPGRPPKNSSPSFTRPSAPVEAEPVELPQTSIFQVETVATGLEAFRPGPPLEDEVILVAEDGPLTEILAEGHGRNGSPVRRLDWRSAGAWDEAPDRLGALILVWPEKGGDLALSRTAFRLLKTAGPALKRAAQAGRPARVLGLTFMGGSFGFGAEGPAENPAAAVLVGLIKTAAREWPEITARALDLPIGAAGASAPLFRPALLAAAAAADAPVELGLARPDRVLALRLTPYRLKNIRVRYLKPGQTVLVTGGARGVTAAALKEMARAWSPHLLILGRTPLKPEEPAWLRGLTDGTAIRQAIWRQSAEKPEPAALALAGAAVLAEREVRANVAALEAAGAKVTYISGAFDEESRVRAALADIKSRYGPIHGFVHGAGILADSLIADKKEADFDRVLNTKASLANLILDELRDQPLNLAAFFSSSTARFGRRGQADYAAGNEYLNKLAGWLAKSRPGLKCLSLNWGPWAGGMVDDSLARLFRQEGVGLIPLGEGARLFASLLGAPKHDPVEMLVLGQGTRLGAFSEKRGTHD